MLSRLTVAGRAALIFLLLSCCALAYYLVFVPVMPPPPPLAAQQQEERQRQWAQQRQLRREQEQQQASAEREHAAAIEKDRQRRKYLCDLAASCKRYSAARLDCAPAADFKACIQIKMGPHADDQVYACGGYGVGAVTALPPDTPSDFECFLLIRFGL